MDPVSHVLFGGVLTSATRRPRPAGLAAAFILGSLVPDIDILLTTAGFDVYLHAHASGTHALVATIVEAVIVAAFVRAIVRRSRVAPLFVAAWIGAVGHIFWDLADSSDIVAFAPFSTQAYGWHLVAMWEPAVLVTMLVTLVIAWRKREHARAAAATGLLALVLILGAKALSQMAARKYYAHVVPDNAIASSARYTPTLAQPFEWTVYDRAGDRVRAWRINSRDARVTLAFERPDAPPTPVVLASKRLPVVRRFLSLDGLPFARIEHEGPLVFVWWSDVRVCAAATCTISFGGAFDESSSTPLYQAIQIGNLRRTRAIPPSSDARQRSSIAAMAR